MTETDTRTILYLLHDAKATTRHLHYLGSTTADQWERRMADHRAGNGGATTRRMVKRGGDLRCVRIWQNVTRDDERTLKKNGHYSKLCPVCKGQLPLILLAPSSGSAARLVDNDPLFQIAQPQTQRRRPAS